MWNIRLREIFISIRIRKTLEILTTLGSSGTKLLLPSWLLGFSTQFLLCWPFHLTQPRAAHLVDPTRLASSRFENQLASSRFKCQLASPSFGSQLTAFFQKSPKILSPSLPGMTSFTSPVSFSFWGFYYDIYDCHILPARAWTPALNVCPYLWTKSNSSKPN